GKAMASALGVRFEPVEVTWGTAIAALQANRIDIMYVLDATPERAEAVDFPASPLLYYSLAVLAKDDLAVRTWEDLNKPEVRIAVPQ
ncbi:transporter substrate-binding domain-containing protein, partial [Erwinia amylovora]|uniref:transporter substrate-binding domain-containing protein n=1 Tax=Erwinia amylovora TaxID=552 RepID=UPI0020BF89DF